VPLDVDEASPDHAYLWRGLLFELRIRHIVGFSVEGQHCHTPPEPPKVTRVLQGPKDPAAATLGRIVVGKEESMLHRGRTRVRIFLFLPAHQWRMASWNDRHCVQLSSRSSVSPCSWRRWYQFTVKRIR